MVTLRRAEAGDRTLLWNIFQKFLYEMTNFYDNEMDAEGNYHYGYLDRYFTEPDRTALFIYADDALAGFAMLNRYSYLNAAPDHVLAEFTVFPRFRRRHIASQAVAMLFEKYKGSWELKYNQKNAAAKALWTAVTAGFSPEKHAYSDEETVLTFRT